MVKNIFIRASIIKHKNKRKQILSVINYIQNQSELHGHAGGIYCGALLLTGKLFYQHIPCKLGRNFRAEYYYDYCFNVARIKELIYSDILIKLSPAEIADTVKIVTEHISNGTATIGETELVTQLSDKMIKEIYFFGTGAVADKYLQYGRPIYLIGAPALYGDYIGILYYKPSVPSSDSEHLS